MRLDFRPKDTAHAAACEAASGAARIKPEAVSCVACGGRCASRPHPDHLPWLARCDYCGTGRVSPQPSEAELDAIYDDGYYATFGYDPDADAGYRRIKHETFDRYLTDAERHISVGRLLDVGSALGDLLLVASLHGWEVQGVEPNPWAARAADRLIPGATRTTTLDALEPQAGAFDLITCVDVIEHLRRPDRAVEQMFDRLRPGGVLLLATPDAGGALARGLGPYWPHYHIDHLWYFSRATLTAVVQATGFEVVSWRRARKVFNLAYIAGILARNSRSRVIQRGAAGALRRLPAAILSAPLPSLPEGQFLLARRPATGDGRTARSASDPWPVRPR